MRAKDFLLLYEAQQELFEVEMSPSNLKRLAAGIDARVGIEFEMAIPDVTIDDDDYEMSENYDYDEPAVSIDDICSFFYDGDYNDDLAIQDLRDELKGAFEAWCQQQRARDWKDLTDNNEKETNNTEEDEEPKESIKKFVIKWIKQNLDNIAIDTMININPDLFGEKIASPDEVETLADLILIKGEGHPKQYKILDLYNDARKSYIENFDIDNYDEREFLANNELNDMSDVPHDFNIRWPYWYSSQDRNDERSIAAIAADFGEAIGTKTYHSNSYHGAERADDVYSVEPDSSITMSERHGVTYSGLEFISPPQSIEKTFIDLKKVKDWANTQEARTNSSTGLHINVSIPNYHIDKLDYVKLALLVGDHYVLNQFSRLGNSYTSSALDIVKNKTSNPEMVDALLTKLRSNMNEIASKIMHSGRTDKFTSINTKSDYIEFRSPGGDWLKKENFDKLENIILRFVVALDAACDPQKYRKEYLKALYKTLKPKNEKDQLTYFSRYIAGDISKNELSDYLVKSRTNRIVQKGIEIINSGDASTSDWVVVFDNGNPDTRVEVFIRKNTVVPTTKEALDVATKYSPKTFNRNNMQYITVMPMLDYVESLRNTIHSKNNTGPNRWAVWNTAKRKQVIVPGRTHDEAVSNTRRLYPTWDGDFLRLIRANTNRTTPDFDKNNRHWIVTTQHEATPTSHPRRYQRRIVAPDMRDARDFARRDYPNEFNNDTIEVDYDPEYYTFEIAEDNTNTSHIIEDWKTKAKGLAAAGAIALAGQSIVPKTTEPSPYSIIDNQLAKVSPELLEKVNTAIHTPLAKALRREAAAAGLEGAELAQFIAQCAHETQNFMSLKEYGGSLDFREYDPKYNPQKAKLLGNTHPGDGARYHGRGFIQLTGRYNYKKAGEALGLPLESQPDLLERPTIAAKVAVWYWQNRVAPKVDNFKNTREVTKPINAGLQGLADREKNFNALMHLLKYTNDEITRSQQK